MNDNDIVKKCASCFVIDNNHILLIFHKKFGKYLQPGGHIEGVAETYQTAIREVFEETGIEIIIDDKTPFNIEVYNTKIGKQLDYQFIGRPINKEIKRMKRVICVHGLISIIWMTLMLSMI